jgi:hypothetical protein
MRKCSCPSLICRASWQPSPARRSPFCGYESDGDESPSSQSRFARRREDRPGCYRIARESAARASGESRESKRGHSKLRAENRVSLRGPAYQVDNASALPSPRFEMLSVITRYKAREGDSSLLVCKLSGVLFCTLFGVQCSGNYRFTRPCCDKVLIETPRIAWLFPGQKSRRSLTKHILF